MSRNFLYALVGALIVCVAVLGYTTYQDKKQPEGLQVTIGGHGLDVKSK